MRHRKSKTSNTNQAKHNTQKTQAKKQTDKHKKQQKKT